ncbi:hypothetical protein NL676_035253 [Syzygium grande]|nr:hypothetical protein NL676_035253 [Syzygium grande]
MAGAGRAYARDNHHNHLITSISIRLERLPPASVDCCIYTVPDKLRKTHKEAFLPRLVSIGPFYHGKQRKAMEDHKWRYLQSFLWQTQKCLEECVEAIKKWEERCQFLRASRRRVRLGAEGWASGRASGLGEVLPARHLPDGEAGRDSDGRAEEKREEGSKGGEGGGLGATAALFF